MNIYNIPEDSNSYSILSNNKPNIPMFTDEQMKKHFDHELTSCLTNIKNLKKRMTELLEQEMESNISVLDWLKKNQQLIEEIFNKEIFNKYNLLHTNSVEGIHFPDGCNISTRERELVIKRKLI